MFKSIIKRHGKLTIALFAMVLFAWGISIKEYIQYGNIVGLILTGFFTTSYIIAFTVEHFKKRNDDN